MGLVLSIYVNKKDHIGETALHKAALKNNFSKVLRLLSWGADVNARDDMAMTPLHIAALGNKGESHLQVVEILLKNGAHVNARDTWIGATPLFFFIEKCNVEMVKFLLTFKADFNDVDKSGQNLLFPAAVNNDNVEVLHLLIDLGLNVKHRSHNGDTPLHSACKFTKIDNTEIIKVLLSNGANLNAINLDGSTPLIAAVRTEVRRHEEKLVKSFTFIVQHSNFNVSVHNYVDILTFDNKHARYPDYFWKIILHHFAKMQALDIPLHPNILDAISRENKCNYHFELYKEELLMAKNTKISKSVVTFFDLLVADKKRLRKYAADKDLVDYFSKSDCVKKFPTYGALMANNFRKGIERRALFNKSTILLSNNCLRIFNSMHFIKDILECITSKKDLLKFCEKD